MISQATWLRSGCSFLAWSLHPCSWSLFLTFDPYFTGSGRLDVNGTIISSTWYPICRPFMIYSTFAEYQSTFSMVFLTMAPQTEQTLLVVVGMGWVCTLCIWRPTCPFCWACSPVDFNHKCSGEAGSLQLTHHNCGLNWQIQVKCPNPVCLELSLMELMLNTQAFTCTPTTVNHPSKLSPPCL